MAKIKLNIDNSGNTKFDITDSGLKATTDLSSKQDKLSAGDNIIISSDSVISADLSSKQDKLSAGNNIIISSDSVISADLSSKQDKLVLVPNDNNKTYADLDNEKLQIWRPKFDGDKNVDDYSIIDSSVAGIESTDDTFGTTKYIEKFYQQKEIWKKVGQFDASDNGWNFPNQVGSYKAFITYKYNGSNEYIFKEINFVILMRSSSFILSNIESFTFSDGEIAFLQFSKEEGLDTSCYLVPKSSKSSPPQVTVKQLFRKDLDLQISLI